MKIKNTRKFLFSLLATFEALSSHEWLPDSSDVGHFHHRASSIGECCGSSSFWNGLYLSSQQVVLSILSLSSPVLSTGTLWGTGKASWTHCLGEEQGALSTVRKYNVVNVSTSVATAPWGHTDYAGEYCPSLSSVRRKDNEALFLQRGRMISVKKSSPVCALLSVPYLLWVLFSSIVIVGF